MSYMVMECHPGYVILLDEEGRFLRAANFCYEVGQTVYDPVLMKESADPERRKLRVIYSSLAAIAACLIMVFGISSYQNYIQPYSYIYMSINPEVQIDLNRSGTVVGLYGKNGDGEKLIEGYSGDGKDKVTVADELIDRAVEMGFLSDGGNVSFAIDSPDDELYKKYEEELSDGVAEYLEGRITVSIEVYDYRTGPKDEENEPDDVADDSDDKEDDVYEPIVITIPATPTPTQTEAATPAPTNIPDPAHTSTPTPVQTAPLTTPEPTAPPATPVPTAPSVPADTDYGPGSDGVTDFYDGNTDYDPGNAGGSNYGGSDDGSNYGEDGGNSGYDNESDYDD